MSNTFRDVIKRAAAGGLLLLTLLAPGAGTQARPPQPLPIAAQALAAAAAQPAARIGVIVQKARADGHLEALVAHLGGTVTKDLHIINAFAAEVPGRALPELAAASGVRWISLDAPVVKSSDGPIDVSNLLSANVGSVQAPDVWNSAPYLQGQGIGVAVVDSGINPQHPDLQGRVVAQAEFNGHTNTTADVYGHGTAVAGIIAGNGSAGNGAYIGMAPAANLLNVKVSDDVGAAESSDVVSGLQWVYDNRARYNIRVVNLSLNSSVYEPYFIDPIDAACEILWFNSVVVVVSAGNNGRATLFPPANDPFVITVGATNDHGTATLADDTIAPFSAYGFTEMGTRKPDLVAPGTNVVGALASVTDTLATLHPANVVGAPPAYFRMSGTSVAAPVVAGAAALLLQSNPALTPDQVKYRLKSTAIRSLTLWPDYDSWRAGTGYVNIPRAVAGTSTASANTGLLASLLLWNGRQPITWNSVSWNSVSWNSVSWNSVSWNSVSWNSDYWGP